MFGATYYHEILRKTIVAFGTLFGIAGLWLFVWCLMWFIDLINELFEEPKVSFLALLLLILIAAIVYYFVK